MTCGLVLAIAGAATQPAAGGDQALYPAAQCAAFWLGYGDYARQSAFLDEDPRDVERASAFRAVAIRLSGGDATEVDRLIAEQRPRMALMMEAYIYGGDRPSRDMFERLTETCETFGRTQPETRELI